MSKTDLEIEELAKRMQEWFTHISPKNLVTLTIQDIETGAYGPGWTLQDMVKMFEWCCDNWTYPRLEYVRDELRKNMTNINEKLLEKRL